MSDINNQNKDKIDETLKEFENENDDSKEHELDEQRKSSDDESENDESSNESDEQEKDDESQSDSEDDEGELEVDEEKKKEERKDEYKDKFTNAQRQAQIEQSKNKKLNDTINQASTIQPTEQELKDYAKTKGVNYDELSTFEKSMLEDGYANKKKFDLVHNAVQENSKIDEWGAKVDDFAENEDNLKKYPHLAGKEAEFRSFSMKQSRRGADLEDLARLFSLESKPEKRKGSLLATNSSGKDKKPTTNALDDADMVASIRRSDPRKYRELVKAGKIKIDV